jgi:hypothetical protein
MIAICGTNCHQCEAYLATQANDEAAKERVAAQWRQAYHAPHIDAAYVTCDGCLASDKRLGGHCLECNIRACGIEHQRPTCAHCPDYDTCDKLAQLLSFASELKNGLDEIRRTLQQT